MKWNDALDALYACHLNEHQLHIWEDFLSDSRPTNAELCDCIKMAANEAMKPEEWKVTVRDLMKWLKIYRKRSILERDKGNRDGMVNQFIEEWRDKIERGCPKDDFINALCVFSNDNGIGISEENEIAGRVIRW